MGSLFVARFDAAVTAATALMTLIVYYPNGFDSAAAVEVMLRAAHGALPHRARATRLGALLSPCTVCGTGAARPAPTPTARPPPLPSHTFSHLLMATQVLLALRLLRLLRLLARISTFQQVVATFVRVLPAAAKLLLTLGLIMYVSKIRSDTKRRMYVFASAGFLIWHLFGGCLIWRAGVPNMAGMSSRRPCCTSLVVASRRTSPAR